MTDYTFAKWVEAKDCHDTTCHDDHPHLTYLDDAEFDRFIASVKAEALREVLEVLSEYSDLDYMHHAKDIVIRAIEKGAGDAL